MRAIVLNLVAMLGLCLWQASTAEPLANHRFTAVNIYLETAEPVAAWQFELDDRRGQTKIVGVENGESAAFRDTPYYDREAVRLGMADRIVVADFSLEEPAKLPTGRIRIATLHLATAGKDEPAFDVDLVTAVTHDGRPIDASISIVLQEEGMQ